MYARSPMLVYFNEIPLSGREFSWMFTPAEGEADCGLDTPLQAQCRVWPVGPEKLTVEGVLRGTVILICDRCLAEYPFQLDSAFQVQAVVQTRAAHLQQREGPDLGLEDCDIVELKSPCLDLDELMRQQHVLALPEKRLCHSDCAGICLRCGANRNEETCGCLHRQLDSPFAVLSGLAGRKTQ